MEGIEKLLNQLDSSDFKTREGASRALQHLGNRAEAALSKRLMNSSLEGRRRIQEILDGLTRLRIAPDELRSLRGIEILERIGSTEARALLDTLSHGDPTARVSQEASAAFKRLTTRSVLPR